MKNDLGEEEESWTKKWDFFLSIIIIYTKVLYKIRQ